MTSPRVSAMLRRRVKARIKVKPRWQIWIPGEGYCPIPYKGHDIKRARARYLKWASRTRLPVGAVITSIEE